MNKKNEVGGAGILISTPQSCCDQTSVSWRKDRPTVGQSSAQKGAVTDTLTCVLTRVPRPFKGEKTVLATSSAGTSTCKRMKLELYLRPDTKVN